MLRIRHGRSWVAALAAAAVFSGCGKDPGGGGDDIPYPGLPGSTRVEGENNLAVILRGASQAQARRTPWAGYWFPYASDGISAAAAKYERAGGEAGAQDWERRHHGSGLAGLQDWWGHCNGWAAAAALEPEPRADANGFSVSEQKALLTEAAMEVKADFFGNRYDGGASAPGAFDDVYPNQFFLVLANYLGRGLPVLMDRYTGTQVWNQPIVGYRVDPVRPTDDLGASGDAGGVYRVNATMTVWWARDDVPGGHVSEPFAFADGPSYEHRTFRMELWLDGPVEFDGDGRITRSGNVILPRQGNLVLGGAWRNGNLDANNSHPDYLWVPQAYAASTGFANPHVGIEQVRALLGRGGAG
jgi:hypothetical protein